MSKSQVDLGAGVDDELVLRAANKAARIRLAAGSSDLWVGGNGTAGDIVMFTAAGDNKTATQATIHLRADRGDIIAGGNGANPQLVLRGADGKNRVRFDAGGANGWFGGNGVAGDIVVFAVAGDSSVFEQGTIHLRGATGDIVAGANGTDGDLVLRAADGSDRVRFDAGGANGWFGGNGVDGDVVVFAEGGDNNPRAGDHPPPRRRRRRHRGRQRHRRQPRPARCERQQPRANGRSRRGLWLGGNGADGDIVLFPSTGDNSTATQASIRLDGEAGDIILANADCAEDFEFEDVDGIEPGTVVEIGDEARLRVARSSYSARVAGIVAGAGSLRPGIVLGRTGGAGRLPVALVGRAYCKVDVKRGHRSRRPADDLRQARLRHEGERSRAGVRSRARQVTRRAAIGHRLGAGPDRIAVRRRHVVTANGHPTGWHHGRAGQPLRRRARLYPRQRAALALGPATSRCSRGEVG